MATKIATLKENGDTVYPLTKVECVYNDNNQNVQDIIDEIISLPIGAIFSSAVPQTSAAFHLLDGSTISKTGIYADFATLLSDLVTAGYNITCTQAQFDSDVSTYGQCGKFVIGTDTIRLPKITKFIEGLSNITNIGTSFQAGLPNITGDSGNNIINHQNENTGSGALYYTKDGNSGGGGGSMPYGHIYLDASRSSSIYGRSSTVQPQSTAYPYYIVLANAYNTQVQVDINNVANDLNNKADVDASNLSSANVDSWKTKLKDINLVAHVVTTSLTNAVSITGLDIVADGGVYDIYVKGNTSNGNLQWLKMDYVGMSQVIYARYGNVYTERQDGAIGLFSDYNSVAMCTIYQPNDYYEGAVAYKSFSFNSSAHEMAVGTGLYTGNGTSIRIYINGNKNFPIGSEVYVYRR